jgi:hypothetical protein
MMKQGGTDSAHNYYNYHTHHTAWNCLHMLGRKQPHLLYDGHLLVLYILPLSFILSVGMDRYRGYLSPKFYRLYCESEILCVGFGLSHDHDQLHLFCDQSVR